MKSFVSTLISPKSLQYPSIYICGLLRLYAYQNIKYLYKQKSIQSSILKSKMNSAQ